ncbi:MAG: TonB-dependent receptor [Deltaproteobacteria bacterium]|nr:TonB-dependent receptor [Deltaproteobacteria bacterium]
MKKVICILSLFIPLASYSFAEQHAAFETETTKELLLYYDWEELLVEAPTRRPTRLKHVAENMTIVTAEEIEAMNAHSLAEVLQNYTGILSSHYGHEFAGEASFHIHDSRYQHIVLLVDGVRFNDDGYWANPGGLPVQIIERIEIVKGPASSAWGSALGGVINVVTKDGGQDNRSSGTLYGSFGEGSSQDYRAEGAGRAGQKVRYYLYGGYQKTDGIQNDENYSNPSFYSKIITDMTEDLSLQFSGGYIDPKGMWLKLPDEDWGWETDRKHYFIKGSLAAALSPDLKLDLDLYQRKIDSQGELYTLSTGEFSSGEFYTQTDNSGSARLTWNRGNHSMLFGGEYKKFVYDRSLRYGPAFQPALPPVVNQEEGDVVEWAFFLNDTIQWSKLTVTPGLRYDHYSIADITSDSEVNPSLGMVYQLTDETLARATVARGFLRPNIVGVRGLDIYGTPAGNPDLKPETDWSFQAGIESIRFKNTHLKADVFYHAQNDTWDFDRTRRMKNTGRASNKGFELNLAVSPLTGLTASLGYTFVRNDPGGDRESEDFQNFIAKLHYKGQRFGNLLLLGRYIEFGKLRAGDPKASYDDMILDAHYNKDIFTSKGGTTLNIFFSVRNIFNGSQYSDISAKNLDRWFEGGLRIRF